MQIPQPPRPRNRLGNTSFVIVMFAAVLASFPATAASGALLGLILVIPAVVALVRVCKNTATNAWRTTGTVLLVPVVLLVAAAVSPTLQPGTAAAAPAAAAPPAALALVEPPAQAAAPALVPTAPAVRTPLTTVLPQIDIPAAAPLLALKSKPRPTTPSCDEATHYVNSSGHCVRRPAKGPSASSGATARCKDGYYSYSEHRRGTCSTHGGVAEWLQ